MIIQIDRNNKKVLIKKEPKAKATVAIDHPENGELIQPQHYAIRISSSEGQRAEISIDGGDWQECRANSGYYWYDWHNIPQGKHKIVARLTLADGKSVKSKIVAVQVA